MVRYHRTTQGDAIVSEFKSPHKDSQGQVQSLYDYIKWCDGQFKQGSQNTWYSPYIYIWQSTAWDKSRIVRQLSALVPVLYLSYQETQSIGYPKRTSHAIDFLRLEVDHSERNPCLDRSIFVSACVCGTEV
jgi:hypothetical protein